jgi:hypothetical protein
MDQVPEPVFISFPLPEILGAHEKEIGQNQHFALGSAQPFYSIFYLASACSGVVN